MLYNEDERRKYYDNFINRKLTFVAIGTSANDSTTDSEYLSDTRAIGCGIHRGDCENMHERKKEGG